MILLHLLNNPHSSSTPEYAACKILALPTKYNQMPMAWGFQKHSPYIPLFNHYLKELREKGSFDKIFSNYEPPPQVCPNYNGLPLGFDSCGAAFLAFMVGPIMAIILFSLEFLTKLCGLKISILELYDKKDGNIDELTDDKDEVIKRQVQLIANLYADISMLKSKLQKNW